MYLQLIWYFCQKKKKKKKEEKKNHSVISELSDLDTNEFTKLKILWRKLEILCLSGTF